MGFGLCLATSACAKAQAKVAAEGPPLAVPEPPPRVLVPAEEPLAAAPPPETPPAPAPRAAARPPAPRRPNTTSAAPEPETKTETPPPPAAVQPTAPTPTEPPRELRPALSAADPAEEKKVRDVILRATRDLGRVDYGKLSSEGRAQYDQSKKFNDQAEQAIKERNYVYAATLADKAAALAAELRGR